VAAAAVFVHRGWLSAEECDLLASLPTTLVSRDHTLCHGSLRDPLWEYVFTPQAAAASLRLAKTRHCCAGHTHVPALYRRTDGGAEHVRVQPGMAYPLAEPLFVNPGSVGQPRDTDPRAAYATIDLDAGTVTFHRAPYQVERTQRRIRERGLPEILADRLAFGM
jgi:diadenosine tetraphosphatase ApaH/serine/threonine PP2A family protein phosphatase